MNFIKRFNYPLNFILSGAIAGLVSTIFTIVHQILITDIIEIIIPSLLMDIRTKQK